MTTNSKKLLYQYILIIGIFILGACDSVDISRADIQQLTNKWAQYTNENNNEGRVAMLSPKATIHLYDASNTSKPTAILSVEVYEKLLRLPEGGRKFIQYLRSNEIIKKLDNKYDVSVTANITETYNESGVISKIKSLEKMSLSRIKGKLYIMRIDVIVGI